MLIKSHHWRSSPLLLVHLRVGFQVLGQHFDVFVQIVPVASHLPKGQQYVMRGSVALIAALFL